MDYRLDTAIKLMLIFLVVVMWNFPILGRYVLKYLDMRCHDVYKLFWMVWPKGNVLYIVTYIEM